MSAAQKFTFDLDLAQKPPRNRVLPEDEFDRLLAEARRAGFEEGQASGRASAEARAAEAQAAATQALAEAAAALAGQAEQMAVALDAEQKRMLAESVQLAASVGRKLAAHLIARQPVDEIAALLADCMSSLDRAPHLVIRCHPDLCDAVKETAEARMRETGFSGRLVVLGEPGIGLGDGRIEWADGGLVRDINAISDEINARIAAYLTARGATKGD